MNKPTLYKGAFRGTDGNGNDHYAADFYMVSEVDKYVEELQAEAVKLRASNEQFELRQIELEAQLEREKNISANRLTMISDRDKHWAVCLEKLEAQLAEKDNTIDNMLTVNDLHVAQLERVRGLPRKWRENTKYMEFTCAKAAIQEARNCAFDLENTLKEVSDES